MRDFKKKIFLLEKKRGDLWFSDIVELSRHIHDNINTMVIIIMGVRRFFKLYVLSCMPNC